MPARVPRPADNPWRDVDGTPIPEQCRVEQIGVNSDYGAMPSRLHQQGRVVGRGKNRLYVRVDVDDKLVSVRPHLVRVLPQRAVSDAARTGHPGRDRRDRTPVRGGPRRCPCPAVQQRVSIR